MATGKSEQKQESKSEAETTNTETKTEQPKLAANSKQNTTKSETKPKQESKSEAKAEPPKQETTNTHTKTEQPKPVVSVKQETTKTEQPKPAVTTKPKQETKTEQPKPVVPTKQEQPKTAVVKKQFVLPASKFADIVKASVFVERCATGYRNGLEWACYNAFENMIAAELRRVVSDSDGTKLRLLLDVRHWDKVEFSYQETYTWMHVHDVMYGVKDGIWPQRRPQYIKVFQLVQERIYHDTEWILLDESDPSVSRNTYIYAYAKLPDNYGRKKLWHGLNIHPDFPCSQ